MTEPGSILKCKSCGYSGAGEYCSRCSQAFEIKRITVKTLLHDIIHFFTHFEKGFGYTLKQLIIAPGHMQRNYIEGNRVKHQKPFSMFFICLTITALCRYWTIKGLIIVYHADIVSEATFFHEYMVITYAALLPVYALIAYLFFYKSGYNFAEFIVLMLYMISIFYLLSDIINLSVFIWPEFDSRYIELPVFTLYITITMLHFFNTHHRWIVIIKSIIILVAAFFLTQEIENFVIRLIT